MTSIDNRLLAADSDVDASSTPGAAVGKDADAPAPERVTLDSYDAAVEQYVDASLAPRGTVSGFLRALADRVGSGTVLELGSGPGWDADELERRGLSVVRSDGAAAFVDRLRRSGRPARLLDVRTDDLGGPYDAVFANAVLLHLSREELGRLLGRARAAVRPGGTLAFTLKEGDGEAWSDAKIDRPRHFTYWREAGVRAALTATGWHVVCVDHVAGRREDWLYVTAEAP